MIRTRVTWNTEWFPHALMCLVKLSGEGGGERGGGGKHSQNMHRLVHAKSTMRRISQFGTCTFSSSRPRDPWIFDNLFTLHCEHRNNTVPQPHARNTLVSLTDHSFCLTAVHMTPFSTSVFPAASPVYQQRTRIRSCGSNISKDNNTRRNTRNRACTTRQCPPTVRSHQGQIRKSEHIPWDENVVSSHYTGDVQLTECATEEFRFQHPSSS